MNGELEDDIAVYVRRSTEEQSDQHQLDDINRWLEYNQVEIGDVEMYAEQASGARADRPEFRGLINAVEGGEITDVVVWEISRIARNGLLAQEFFESCEEHEVTIHVTDGAVRRIEPDGHGRLVADIVAAVAAEERRRLIDRTKSGITRARKEGKWVGQVPSGFVTNDGYLKPNVNPDYEAGQTGFFDLVDAMERLEDGDSYRSVASETPNVTRPTLMRIHKDEDRRSWYLDIEAEDGRVEEALEGVDSE